MKNLLLAGFFLLTWNDLQLQTNSDCSKVKWTKECAETSVYDIVTTTSSIMLNNKKEVEQFKKMISPAASNLKIQEIKTVEK